jgi:cytochrome c oxidase subunit IV
MTEMAEGQQHPIRLYLFVWGWLFVLSFFSYMVDYIDFQGFWRWFLVLTFMTLKAGLIVAIFMHMRWERLSLIYAILVPPSALLILVLFLAVEGGYVALLRETYFN